MKKISIIALLPILLSSTGCSFNRTPVENLSEIAISIGDYKGEREIKYTIDFENNIYKKLIKTPEDYGVQKVFEDSEKIFTEEQETKFLKEADDADLFTLKEKNNLLWGIINSEWSIEFKYLDGSSYISKGQNGINVSKECAVAFYHLCGEQVIGDMPDYFFTPPNQPDIAFEYVKDGVECVNVNGLVRFKLGNYVWSEFTVTNADYYELNNEDYSQYGIEPFNSSIEYSFGFYTANYPKNAEKFKKMIVKEYDFNKELTNEKVVFDLEWFKKTNYVKLELEKIYICRFEFSEGRYAEYTFTTHIW